MRVFVTGATGLIGRRVIARLLARGDEVRALTRSPARARGKLPGSVDLIAGDLVAPGKWVARLADCDTVVHLAGEPIVGRRWTPELKARIRSSRVDGTSNLATALGGSDARVFLSASAVGYYGNGSAPVDEESPPGDDFLGRLCNRWEQAALTAATAQRRVVRLRIGIVLDRHEGALAKMVPAFRAFVGGPVGNGQQWVSWIHHEDVVSLVLFALDDARCDGALNATAPAPVTMRELADGLGRALGRPSWLPAPALALRALFGEGAEPLLTGQNVIPKRALALGFKPKFPSLAEALAEIFAARLQGL
jgi:uncharacterized protein (TIGR01777 family)